MLMQLSSKNSFFIQSHIHHDLPYIYNLPSPNMPITTTLLTTETHKAQTHFHHPIYPPSQNYTTQSFIPHIPTHTHPSFMQYTLIYTSIVYWLPSLTSLIPHTYTQVLIHSKSNISHSQVSTITHSSNKIIIHFAQYTYIHPPSTHTDILTYPFISFTTIIHSENLKFLIISNSLFPFLCIHSSITHTFRYSYITNSFIGYY